MGAPKKFTTVKVPQKTGTELRPVPVSERIRAFDTGRSVGRSLDTPRLVDVLNGFRGLFWPLVQWLDKPLADEPDFQESDWAKENIRALVLHRGFDQGDFIGLALGRGGGWLVRVFKQKHGFKTYQRMDSDELARLMIEIIDERLFDLVVRDDRLAEPFGNLIKKIPELKPVLRYQYILDFFTSCIKVVDKTIQDRENRIQLMRDHLATAGSLVSAMDPIVTQDKGVDLPHFSIERDDDRGTTVVGQGYFHSSALKPIWETIGSYRPDPNTKYREVGGEDGGFGLPARCLEDLSSRIIREFRDGSKTLPGQLPCAHGRYPINDDEIAVIRRILSSLLSK